MALPKKAGAGKPSRTLVENVLWGTAIVAVLVIILKFATGNTIEEETRQKAEEKRVHETSMSQAVTPASVASSMNNQQEEAAKENASKKKPEEPQLQMPTGTPTPGGQVPTFSSGGGSGGDPSVTDPARYLNQARASRIDAYESSSQSSLAKPQAGNATSQNFQELTQQLKNIQAPTQPTTQKNELVDKMLAAQSLGAQQPPGSKTLTQSSNDWLSQQQGSNLAAVAPLQVSPRAEDFTLFEGADIPIALQKSINSDLPGTFNAMVTRDVYDSLTGRCVVIPKFSRVRGVYNSEIVPGQSRILFAFTRMIFPNGASIRLGAMPGQDLSGSSGAEADVETHFWTIFGSSLAIGAATLAIPNNNNNVTINVGGGSASTIAGQALSDTVKQILSRNINIKPTLRLALGEPLLISTTRDMVLPPTSTGGTCRTP